MGGTPITCGATVWDADRPRCFEQYLLNKGPTYSVVFQGDRRGTIVRAADYVGCPDRDSGARSKAAKCDDEPSVPRPGGGCDNTAGRGWSPILGILELSLASSTGIFTSSVALGDSYPFSLTYATVSVESLCVDSAPRSSRLMHHECQVASLVYS